MLKIKKTIYILLPVVCFICNISQLPAQWNNRTLSTTYTLLWVTVMLMACFRFKFAIFINKVYLTLLLFFDALIIGLQVFGDKNYLSSNFIFPIHLCFFVMFTSGLVGRICDRDIVMKVANAYVISSLVIAISIYREFFSGVDWLNAKGYLYTAKNSVAIIFLSAIVFIYFYWLPKYKITSWVLIAILSSLIFMMKSRATILVWLVLAVYILVVNRATLLGKFVGLFICLIIMLLVIYQPHLHEIFIDNIFLNNKGAEDWGTLTSGRDQHYEWFEEHFGDYWVIGTGGTYLESFPLAVLMSYGVIGAIPVFGMAIFPFFAALKAHSISKFDKEVKLVMILNVILIVNGFFEELTPFGPGVKCYALWMMMGLLLGFVERERLKR